MRRWIWLCGVVFLCVAPGCAPQEQAEKEDTGSGPELSAASKLSFDGLVVPSNATKLRAPQNSFKLAKWKSSSGWIKLIHLAPEGVEVKKGDVVGRFEFRGESARNGVTERIANTRANREKTRIAQEQELAALQTSLARQKLSAERAELDTRREGVVSQRQLSIFKIGYKQARFEADALAQKIRVNRESLRSEVAYHDQLVKRAEEDEARLNKYKERFSLLAPHDGVVRYAPHPWRRRKIQQGDGMSAGLVFASLARDTSIEIKFYVPEAHLHLISEGGTVKINAPALGEEVPGVVTSIGLFPQELGFLREDNEIPGAREKVYVVKASFETQPRQMKAGLEIKVLLR